MEWTAWMGSTDTTVVMGPTGQTAVLVIREYKDLRAFLEAVDRRVTREYLDLQVRRANVARMER